MIEVTARASKHIIRALNKRGKGIGVRIGVRTTGCSGLAYTMEYVDECSTDDIQVATEGFSLFIDPKHEVYLKEITVDYVRKGLNEGFEFINPIEKDRCGCGESFRV